MYVCSGGRQAHGSLENSAAAAAAAVVGRRQSSKFQILNCYFVELGEFTALSATTTPTTSSQLHNFTKMTVNTEPEALLSHLPKADGSATFSYAGYTIIGAVNGPIEVQRRDELPEEAAVDVIVRPAAGVGGMSFSPT